MGEGRASSEGRETKEREREHNMGGETYPNGTSMSRVNQTRQSIFFYTASRPITLQLTRPNVSILITI